MEVIIEFNPCIILKKGSNGVEITSSPTTLAEKYAHRIKLKFRKKNVTLEDVFSKMDENFKGSLLRGRVITLNRKVIGNFNKSGQPELKGRYKSDSTIGSNDELTLYLPVGGG